MFNVLLLTSRQLFVSFFKKKNDVLMSELIICGWSGWPKSEKEAVKRGILVREKWILVRDKSVKSQGISFQTKSGHPEIYESKGSDQPVATQSQTLIILKIFNKRATLR